MLLCPTDRIDGFDRTEPYWPFYLLACTAGRGTTRRGEWTYSHRPGVRIWSLLPMVTPAKLKTATEAG